jgi:hypothetical protein
MTVAVAITARGAGPFAVTNTTLTTGPDTLAYVAGNGMILELENTTVGSITTTLLGSTSSATYSVPGAGATTINAAAGLAVVVAAGAKYWVELDKIQAYLQGAVTLTSTASGMTAVCVKGQ